MILWSKLTHFHSRKCIWKCRLRNGGHFASAPMWQNELHRSLIRTYREHFVWCLSSSDDPKYVFLQSKCRDCCQIRMRWKLFDLSKIWYNKPIDSLMKFYYPVVLLARRHKRSTIDVLYTPIIPLCYTQIRTCRLSHLAYACAVTYRRLNKFFVIVHKNFWNAVICL